MISKVQNNKSKNKSVGFHEIKKNKNSIVGREPKASPDTKGMAQKQLLE